MIVWVELKHVETNKKAISSGVNQHFILHFTINFIINIFENSVQRVPNSPFDGSGKNLQSCLTKLY